MCATDTMTDCDKTESIPLRLLIQAGFLFMILANASVAQDVNNPSGESIDGLPRVEVTRRIFEGEQATMRRLRIYSPIVETYIQSLRPDTAAQIPIDDLYFLSKVEMSSNFLVGDEGNSRLFGRSEESRRVLDDNGQRQELYPAGFIHMLFIDPQSFDSDTYRLTYLQQTTLGPLNCLLFAVDPIKADTPGRFRGKVWVERKGLKVVRVQGTFQVERLKLRQRLNLLRRTAGFFIRFDCWRQIIAADLWAPAYVNIDDNIPWKGIGGDGTTDLHYRGHAFVWGYSYLGSFRSRLSQRTDAADNYGQVVAGLEREGLVGSTRGHRAMAKRNCRGNRCIQPTQYSADPVSRATYNSCGNVPYGQYDSDKPRSVGYGSRQVHPCRLTSSRTGALTFGGFSRRTERVYAELVRIRRSWRVSEIGRCQTRRCRRGSGCETDVHALEGFALCSGDRWRIRLRITVSSTIGTNPQFN